MSAPVDALNQWLAQHKLDSLHKPLSDNDIDLDIIADLTESDLTDIGLSLGKRKRLLRAIAVLDAPPSAGNFPAPAPKIQKPASTRRALHRLVGREAELYQLQQTWSSVCRGTGCFVIIEGSPGIGKSRLIREMQGWFEPQPTHFAQWMCSSSAVNSEFFAETQYVQKLCGITGSQHTNPGQALQQTLIELAGMPARKVDRLLQLLGVVEASSEPAFATPRDRRAMTIDLLVELIGTMVGKGPVVLVVEDADVIDSSTHALLETLHSDIESIPLMVVVTRRPQSHSSSFSLSSMHKLSLMPLNDADCTRLVAEHGKLPGEIASEILRKANGIPMFVEEATRALFEVGHQQMNKAD